MNAPHCPKCGGEMVRETEDSAGNLQFTTECEACGFGGTGSSLRNVSYKRDHSVFVVSRLVRRELAEQALTMRAHGHASETEDFDPVGLALILPRVMKDYELLGRHPIRLPGEDA